MLRGYILPLLLTASNPPEDFGGVCLQLCEPQFHKQITLEASGASLSFLELSDDGSDEESIETQLQPQQQHTHQRQQRLPVLLQLEGLGKQRRRHRRHRRHPGSSGRSNSSCSSRSSHFPSLPTIEEHI